MKTMKQLQQALNTNDIKVVKESGYYIIKKGDYESEFTYTLKELINDVAVGTIKMVFSRWTMQGIKVTTIKGLN